MMTSRPARLAPCAAAALLLIVSPDAGRAAPSQAELSGRDIYQRVLDNRFKTAVQISRLRSGDRAGNDQESRFRMWFKNYRDEPSGSGPGEMLSKTLVKYLAPFDIRHSGYLIIHMRERPSDQFVYLSSRRRIQRINLRGKALFGTDFSFEDVIPREIEDADYTRKPDSEIEGIPCFLVEARPKPETDSEYSRFDLFVEKARYVPLRTRYWSESGVEIKQLDIDPARIEQIEGKWIPRHMTMKDLREDSFTELNVEEIEPNPPLRKTTFDLRRLESH